MGLRVSAICFNDIQRVYTEVYRDWLADNPADYIRSEAVKRKIDYREVRHLTKPLSEAEIIQKLSGGDKTKGSCASQAMAYFANKAGYDVIDYRGGESQVLFSGFATYWRNYGTYKNSGKSETQDMWDLLQEMDLDKEYQLAGGRHTAVVRRTKNGWEYLELQSPGTNGWIPIGETFYEVGAVIEDMFYANRFDIWNRDKKKFEKRDYSGSFLLDPSKMMENEEYFNLLGYINTDLTKQMKGADGHVK